MAENGIVGVILAGGQARRMGGRQKFALKLDGRRLIDIAVERLAPQVDVIVVAANSDVGGGLASCPDIIGGSKGPLAGLHAAMVWAEDNVPEAGAIASVPVDCPFFPRDLVAKLDAAGPPAYACVADWRHQIFGLWPRDLASSLGARLTDGQALKVEAFAAAAGAKEVEFPDPDAFFNINCLADLEAAARMLERDA